MKKIDTTLIKNSRKKSDGAIVGQCPVCAEDGHDQKEEHLIVYPDGKFTCVVHQGDKEHNREIRQLLGKEVNDELLVPIITVNPYPVRPKKVAQTFGRLGHLFATPDTGQL